MDDLVKRKIYVVKKARAIAPCNYSELLHIAINTGAAQHNNCRRHTHRHIYVKTLLPNITTTPWSMTELHSRESIILSVISRAVPNSPLELIKILYRKAL